MKKALGDYWRRIKAGGHGTRFVAFYDYRQAHRKSLRSKIVTIFIGASLAIFGASIGWMPGPGGFVGIIGLALLAQEFRPLAVLLDKIEIAFVHMWRGFRSLSPVAQSGVVLMLFALSAGVGYFAYETIWMR